MSNRLQKKCFVAAAGLHLLLVVILMVGPGFLSSSQKAENRPMIDFVPTKTIDQLLSGGGNPRAAQQTQPTPVQPPQPQPPAPQPPTRTPEPVQRQAEPPAPKQQQTPIRQPDPPKTVERDPLANPTKPVRKLPDVSLEPVRRPGPANKQKSNAKQSPKSDDRATQIARAAESASSSLSRNVSQNTVGVPEPRGPGGGGPTYANFEDAVRRVYYEAWVAPDGAANEDASVESSVTIARNGDVISTRVIKFSGNAAVDQSVSATLNRVRKAVPLPEDTKETQRIVLLRFNARAVRGNG